MLSLGSPGAWRLPQHQELASARVAQLQLSTWLMPSSVQAPPWLSPTPVSAPPQLQRTTQRVRLAATERAPTGCCAGRLSPVATHPHLSCTLCASAQGNLCVSSVPPPAQPLQWTTQRALPAAPSHATPCCFGACRPAHSTTGVSPYAPGLLEAALNSSPPRH